MEIIAQDRDVCSNLDCTKSINSKKTLVKFKFCHVSVETKKLDKENGRV